MIRYGYIFFLLSLFNTLQAQKHDYYWILGSREDTESSTNIGSDLQFSDDQPVTTLFVPRDYTINHSIATICDREGELRFASNICNIYDRFHQPIPGGDRLFDHPLKSRFCDSAIVPGYRGFQMSFFLPHPAHDQQFLFFYMAMDTADRQDFSTHLFYAHLDADSNSILSKDQLLIESKMTTGMMTAVRHADGKSWWILIPEQTSNSYFSFLLDEKGNFHGPFKQTIGLVNQPRVWTGSAAFSPDGRWYARFDEANGLQIMHFDRCTGLLSDFKRLYIPFEIAGGAAIAFSPNSKHLYCAEPFNLYQLDLHTPGFDVEDILHIAHIDVNPDGPQFPTGFDKMQLGPDGKIYFTNWSSPWLHVIHDPNQSGTDCNLQQHALKMRSYLMSSMPYMPNYRLGPISCEDACCGDPNAQQSPYTLSPNPGKGLYRIRATDAHMNRFRLFDVSGKLLMDNRFIPCLESEIDIRHLPPGLYPLHIHGPDTFHTYKLLKI